MKLSELLVNVAHQLTTKMFKDESSQTSIILKVEPKDKALVAFLVCIASGETGERYGSIDTGIRGHLFDYWLLGAEDEINLVFESKAFSNGNTLQSCGMKLLSALTALIKKLITGWTQAGIEQTGKSYENEEIQGIYSVFLLEQMALNLGFNSSTSDTLEFTTWIDRMCLTPANKIIVTGTLPLIEQFIATLTSELGKAIDVPFSVHQFLQKKGLASTLFNNKIAFESPIEDHAAWAFKFIYSAHYKNTSGDIARMCHGMSHICRAAIYAPVWLNLFRLHGYEDAFSLTDIDLKLIQIALLFHDAAREDDEEDKWDLESAALLYFYLKMLGIEDEKAITLAEAVANKDSETIYRNYKLVITPSEMTWETIVLKKCNMFQIIIHDSDCLDIIRARNHFDATRLFFYRLICSREQRPECNPHDYEQLAQLITEARSIIRKHGDHRGALQLSIKKHFEQENGYLESVKTIHDANYRILPKLYHSGMLLSLDELKIAIQLPTQGYNPELGLEEFNIKNALREGVIFARGIIDTPSAMHAKLKKTAEGEVKERTLAEVELQKAARRKGIDSKGQINPEKVRQGNASRSVCMLFPGGSVLCPTGFLIINPKDKDIFSISIVDSDTGWQKKPSFFANTSKLTQSEVVQKKQLLKQQLKLGGSSKMYSDSQFPATYNEITYDITEYDAIYFTQDPVRSNAMFSGDPESKHAVVPLLQAIYLQQEYAKKHQKILPIFEYSGVHNFINLLPEKDYTDEKIKQMWISLCCDYVISELRINTLYSKANLGRLSIEDMKIAAMYGSNRKSKVEVISKRALPDRLYSDHFKKDIDVAIDEALNELIMQQNKETIENMRVAKNDLIQYVNAPVIDDLKCFNSSFMIAAMNGRDLFLRLFLSADSDVNDELVNNLRDTQGRSLFFYAAFFGHIETMKLLMAHGASINTQCNRGFSALHAAVQEGHCEIVAYLLSNGADSNIKNFTGTAPLHSVFMGERLVSEAALKIIGMLLESSAEVNACTKYGFLPIHHAIEKIKDKKLLETIVSLLVNKGSDINHETDISIKLLIKYWNGIPQNKWPSILINHTDKKQKISGLSLLHYAVLSNNEEAVTILLALGAQITNGFLGFDCIELAKTLGRTEMLELLSNQSEINSKRFGATSF